MIDWEYEQSRCWFPSKTLTYNDPNMVIPKGSMIRLKEVKNNTIVLEVQEPMPMSDGELQVVESLFRDPYEPGLAVVKEVRRLKEELQQHKRGWDGSNAALAKAYQEIDDLKKSLRREVKETQRLAFELSHTKQPKGLPTEYNVAEASLLIQKLAEGIRYVEQMPSPYATFNFPWKYGSTSVFIMTHPPIPVPSFVNVTVSG